MRGVLRIHQVRQLHGVGDGNEPYLVDPEANQQTRLPNVNLPTHLFASTFDGIR